ncbi:MAG: DUF4407 domain-containing protein [bacterium]|nr:DUF4407 domain-containing protein [bacterium]
MTQQSKHYPYKDHHQYWKITKWLWECAGADREILQNCTYSDAVKYACLGGIVLGTGVFAFLSMTFAMSIIFPVDKEIIENGATKINHNFAMYFVHYAVGLFWGYVIFNLDRFIVSSTGKGDGKDSISRNEFLNALPRIIMAIIIGLTISAPLEIYLFYPEIQKQFITTNDDKLAIQNEKIEAQFKSDLTKIIDDIKEIQAIKDRLLLEIEKTRSMVIYETSNGDCKSKCIEFKRQLAQDLYPRDSILFTAIAKLQLERNGIYYMMDSLKLSFKRELNLKPGFLECILTLGDIPDSGIPVHMVQALFLLVECAPVFFKLMIAFSPYDYLEKNIKEIRLAEMAIEKRTELQNINGKNVEVESLIFHGAEHLLKEKIELLNAQEKIAKKIIDKWTIQKEKDIDDNPNNFYS